MVYCTQDPSSKYSKLSLLEYGFPIDIMAPDSPVIKTFDLVVKKDITIQKGDDYLVQIFMGNATIYDAKRVKDQLLDDFREDNEYFEELILNEDQGFIYKTAVDTLNPNYGFFYVKVQGDKEFIFQPGIMADFSLEEIERMYGAVKNE